MTELEFKLGHIMLDSTKFYKLKIAKWHPECAIQASVVFYIPYMLA